MVTPSPPTTSTPKVSVIIPVFNDVQRLSRCLDALEKQTYPKDSYEVVVVDNASTVDIRTPVSNYSQACYEYEPKAGSYAARNKGLSVAGGEVIAFTDSDCVPAPDWIEQGVDFLRSHPECGLAGGAIELFYRDPGRMTGVEIYESIAGFPQRQYIENDHFGATANVFTYRQVIDAVGPFNDNLKSGGDADWGKRVARSGYQLLYADGVKVAHPARSTYSEYYAKTLRVMSGLTLYRNSTASVGDIVGSVLKGIFIPPVSGIRSALRQAGERGVRDKLKLAMVVLFIRYVWVFEGARLQLRNRRTP